MTFENLSNGETDGFALFYMKDKKLNAVLLNEKQAGKLDLSLKLIFAENKAKILNVDAEEIKKLI